MRFRRFINYFHQNKAVCLLLFLVLVFITFYIVKHSLSISTISNKMPLKMVEIDTVKRKNIRETIQLIGTIHPKHATTLISKRAGTLKLLIFSGQVVSKGTLVAKINNPSLEKSYDLSKRASQIAKKQYQRLNDLYKKGFISSKEVEEKKQAWIEASKNLAQTKMELDTLHFYAPFDGIVGSYKKHDGTEVHIGETIVAFYDPSELTVDFDIPCTLSTHLINDKQQVQILGKIYPINHVQKMLDEETHMCPADVAISCQDCLIGASVDVRLITRAKTKVLVIPNRALFLKNGKPSVYVVKKGKISLVFVRTGIKERSQVEIISGLKIGQSLVLSGQEQLYPGLPVQIQKDVNVS